MSPPQPPHPPQHEDKSSPPPSDDEHSEHEHGHAELAPLPNIPRARRDGRGSFTSGVGVGVGAAGVLRQRPRAMSAGAGAGGVATIGVGTGQRAKPRTLSSASRGRPARVRNVGMSEVGELEEMDGDDANGDNDGRSISGFATLGRATTQATIVTHPPPAFSPLVATASRLSQTSNLTFADPLALVNLPDLTLRREETLTRSLTRTERRARARAGTVTTIGSLARMRSVFSDNQDRIDEDEDTEKWSEEESEEGEDEIVAVTVTDKGEEIVYPDGGTQAWLCLTGGVSAAICAFGLAGSVGAFQSYYASHLLAGYSSSTIAWIGSAQAAVCFSMAAFTGPLFDRYGCRPLLATGTLLLVIAFCLLSLCTQFYQIFLCHATLMAMGMDLMFIVPMGAVGQWFFLKRGLAFGILMMGSSAGAIIWPAIMANLPDKIGFPWTVRLIALLVGLLGALSTLLVRTRLPPRPPGPFFQWAEFRNPAYACVAFSFPFFAFGFFSFLTFIGTYGKLANLGPLAPYLLMIANGASGFGRVAAGLLADMFGTFNVAVVGLAIMVVFNFAWLGMKTAPSLTALCIVYGFMSGAPVSLQGPMVTASATDPRMAGTLIGQALLVQSFAQLCGPPIFGAIVGTGTPAEMLARFPNAIAFGACMLTLAMVFILAARLNRSRELWVIV